MKRKQMGFTYMLLTYFQNRCGNSNYDLCVQVKCTANIMNVSQTGFVLFFTYKNTTLNALFIIKFAPH